MDRKGNVESELAVVYVLWDIGRVAKSTPSSDSPQNPSVKKTRLNSKSLPTCTDDHVSRVPGTKRRNRTFKRGPRDRWGIAMEGGKSKRARASGHVSVWVMFGCFLRISQKC